MKQNKLYESIVAQNSLVKGRVSGESPAAPQKTGGGRLSKPPKPQISSIPGLSPKERRRYRVMLGDVILGDLLTIDEALELVRGGGR
jgi:hypothetical protein